MDINLQSILSRRSALVLILANLIPLIGVLLFNWELSAIIFIYWTESLSVGFFNILKMVMIGTHKNELVASLLLIPFFVIHYGLFTAVEGLLIATIFGIPKTPVVLPATFLFLSHGYSFVDNFVSKNSHENRDMKKQMFMPYRRVVALQVFVILGGFAVLKLGAPVIAILILIIAKTAIDVISHSTQHSTSV